MPSHKSRPPRRLSGVLLPISALPSAGGIGDLGPAARAFVDWLHRARQRAWQILPLSIPDSTGSPYASLSSAAGNWLFISGQQLRAERLLPSTWIDKTSGPRVKYQQVFRSKWRMIRVSYAYFVEQATKDQRQRFDKFKHQQRDWLEEYSVFQALKDRHRQQPWWTWEEKWKTPARAKQNLDRPLRHQMLLHAYAQWVWHEQWQALRKYAHRRGVKIIGDMPFYVRTDSVNVWAKPGLFHLRANGQPTAVAGVPPDDFSRTGQRWGNPLYNWPAHRRQGWRWWIDRFRLLHDRVDIVRFDHFRGLIHTWHIPARAQDATSGHWVPTPGRELLRAVKQHVPQLDLIAEDLGPAGLNADALRRAFHAPTIRVLLFGWNGLPNNPHAPSAIRSDMVYYTANHDTNTTVGWWRREAKWYERKHIRQTVGRGQNIGQQMIEVAMATPAQYVITPIQDVLELSSSARFNHPGRRRGNWNWRLRLKQLNAVQARRLARITVSNGRQ